MRIGVIGYQSKTGIGIMVDEFAEKLGAVAQLVIPHEKADDLIPSNDRVMIKSLAWTADARAIKEFASLVDVAISVESDWGGLVYPLLREFGVKVVLLPMFEWWNPSLPMNKHIDLFICTTKQCYEGVPFKNKVFIPCPVDTHKIIYRQRTGKPKLFIHNAGNLGINGRKGTLEVVSAFCKTRSPEISLKINSQVFLTEEIVRIVASDKRISLFVKNHENYSELYAEGDVLIYTPHYDGQALVSAEAMAAGLPVITIDEPPMNEHWRIYNLHSDSCMYASVAESVNAETLNPRSLCHYVDTGDLSMVINAVTELEMDGFSEDNREIAEKCFSWDVCLTFYSHYLEVIWDT